MALFTPCVIYVSYGWHKYSKKETKMSLRLLTCWFMRHNKPLHSCRCAWWFSSGGVRTGSRVAVTAVLVIGTEGCRLGTPSFGALFNLPLLPLPPSSPSFASLSSSSSASLSSSSSARLVFWAGCLQLCNFTIVYYGADIRGDMNSVSCKRACLPPRASVRVWACVRSQHMLSSVSRSEPSLRRCTCRLRSQHELSEHLSGANACVSILST